MGADTNNARRARRDAERDMAAEGEPPTRCPHPAPWDSEGPIRNGGRIYTVYRCPDCGRETNRHYYR